MRDTVYELQLQSLSNASHSEISVIVILTRSLHLLDWDKYVGKKKKISPRSTIFTPIMHGWRQRLIHTKVERSLSVKKLIILIGI